MSTSSDSSNDNSSSSPPFMFGFAPCSQHQASARRRRKSVTLMYRPRSLLSELIVASGKEAGGECDEVVEAFSREGSREFEGTEGCCSVAVDEGRRSCCQGEKRLCSSRPIAIVQDSVSLKRWQKECLRRALAAYTDAEMQRAACDPRFQACPHAQVTSVSTRGPA